MKQLTSRQAKEDQDKYLSCHQFLFIVQEIGRSNLWSDTKMMQIIVECLENEALEWYNNIHPCSSLDQSKILMISAFSPKISILFVTNNVVEAFAVM